MTLEQLGEIQVTSASRSGKAMETIRVLLIEDNPGNARLVSRMLQSAQEVQFEVQYAADLGSALRLIKVRPVDVVLMDLGLPDALELEGVYRMSAAAPEIPIIVLTGTEVPQTILDTIKIGVRDYFVKSRIEPQALIGAILRQAERTRQLSCPARTDAAEPAKRTTKGPRVLVIEDNPGDLALIRRMLASSGRPPL